MKQISSLELYFSVKELKDLEVSRVDRVYNAGKEELFIQLHKSDIGKKILRIIIGKAMFLTETKNSDETPSGFCMLLRKHLEGKFLESIEQIKPERIAKLDFKSKEEKRFLYLEFFGKGNIILCDENNVIIDSLLRHKFKDRTIMPKEKYQYPSMQYNLFELKEKQLTELLKNSKKDKIVISLATELGLGGIYSEEICLLSNINKNNEPKQLDNKDAIIIIINSIKKIIDEKTNPKIVYKNKEAIDVIPIDFNSYKDYEKREFDSFNSALEYYFTNELKLIKKKESSYIKKINELKRITEEQQIVLNGLKVKEEENRKKGELIYYNYKLIKEILEEINKASKKYSWEDIREKLKGHKTIREINTEDRSVVIDV